MLLRLPLIGIVVGVLLTYHYVLSPLLIYQSLRRVTDLVINFLLIRLLLLIMGFITLPPMVRLFQQDYRHLLPDMKSGYMILSNHCSPVDYLYFQMLASPTVVKYCLTS